MTLACIAFSPSKFLFSTVFGLLPLARMFSILLILLACQYNPSVNSRMKMYRMMNVPLDVFLFLYSLILLKSIICVVAPLKDFGDGANGVALLYGLLYPEDPRDPRGDDTTNW